MCSGLNTVIHDSFLDVLSVVNSHRIQFSLVESTIHLTVLRHRYIADISFQVGALCHLIYRRFHMKNNHSSAGYSCWYLEKANLRGRAVGAQWLWNDGTAAIIYHWKRLNGGCRPLGI